MRNPHKPFKKRSNNLSTGTNIIKTVTNKSILIISIFLLIVIAITISILNAAGFFGKPKIAYVRSQELVYGYLGMKEAHNKYSEKMQQWQMNKQTLESDYQTALAKYKEEVSNLSEEDKSQREDYLKKLQANIENYTNSISSLAKEEDEKTTQAVLNQINSFVQDYGERQGFDIILGTTLSGNILYGQEALDITEEVLYELNKAYVGEEQN